jgi:hypothetical protein
VPEHECAHLLTVYTQRFDSGRSGAHEIKAFCTFHLSGCPSFCGRFRRHQRSSCLLWLRGRLRTPATRAGAEDHNALTFELDPSVGVDQAAQYAVFRTRRGKTSMDTNTLLIIIILILLVGGGWFGRGRWF